MKSIYQNHFWKIFAICSILIQTLLTLKQVKFFPFSDHGVFEAARKIQGQRFYRIITKESFPHYEEEGILYETSYQMKSLLEFRNLKPEMAITQLDKEVMAIDRFTLGNSKTPPLFNKERIYQK